MLTRLSAGFINLQPSEVDGAIDAALRQIVDVLDIDRLTVLRLDPDGRSFTRAHSYTRPGLPQPALNVQVFDFPWCLQQVNRGEVVAFDSTDDLPPEAATDKASFDRAARPLAMVVIPLKVAGKSYGTLNFLCANRPHHWSEEMLSRARVVAELFGNTIARRHVQEELEQLLGFEQLLVDVTASLVSLPREVNASAVDEAITSGLRRMAQYLQVDRVVLWSLPTRDSRLLASHIWSGTPEAAAVASGAQLRMLAQRLRSGAILRSDQDNLPTGFDSGDRALLDSLGIGSLLALPLKVAGRVVAAISLDDSLPHRVWPDALLPRLRVVGEVFATALARQRAEQSAQEARADAAQQRERLAHVSRLYTVGEMSAGIAHEINQPLMAIENYALAARRHAAAEPANLAKICGLLDKITIQSSRAGDVIGKLRSMVRRHDVDEWERVGIGQIVRDSLRFAEMEGHLSDVAVSLCLRDEQTDVFADQIQIQQVIVNLVRNAVEAMNHQEGERTKALQIESGLADPSRVFMRVADTGPGFAEGHLERIFEPFFSTKEAGLGIGLALCRTIVEAHGGGVSAQQRPGGGAILEFTLPIAQEIT